MNRSSMQFEDDLIIVRFDHRGLLIVKKDANYTGSDFTSALELNPEQALSFSRMWGMGNGAIQVMVMGGGHQVAHLFSDPEEDEDNEDH